MSKQSDWRYIAISTLAKRESYYKHGQKTEVVKNIILQPELEWHATENNQLIQRQMQLIRRLQDLFCDKAVGFDAYNSDTDFKL